MAKATLCVLVHYLLGRSYSPYIGTVRKLEVYNPHLDATYTIAIAEIPRRTMESAEGNYVEDAQSYRKPSRHCRSSGASLPRPSNPSWRP